MKSRKFRSFSALLALTALMSLFTLTAQPTPAAAHGSYQNGCTFSPDSGRYFNFHNACDRHDLCYRYKYYGNSSAGRKSCDIRFLNDMRASCVSRYPSNWSLYQRGRCYTTAQTYYGAVRAVGWKFF